MKKTFLFFLMIVCLLPCITLPGAAVQTAQPLLTQQDIALSAQSAILYELDTHTLLYAKDTDERFDPSGFSKSVAVATALRLCGERGLDIAQETILVTQETLDTLPAGAKSIGLRAQETLTVQQLLYCVAVGCADDAAVVLAQGLSGSQEAFVSQMNAYASSLGCTDTHFSSVHGLTADAQYTTAAELAVLLEDALAQEAFALLYETVSYLLPQTTLSGARALVTSNRLINSGTADFDARVTGGMALSHASDRYSLFCTSKTEAGRYLCIIACAPSRTSSYVHYTQAQKLLDRAYADYSVCRVMSTEQSVAMYAVKNADNGVVAVPAQDVYALLPKEYDTSALRSESVQTEQALRAPLTRGSPVGTLRVLYKGVCVGRTALVAAYDVPSAGERIENVEPTRTSRSLRAVKWIIIVAVIAVALGLATLVTLRQINLRRYRKNRAVREENEHGLE